MKTEAIGFFDSGIGGLTVVRELLKQLPNERIIYIGDTARSPYGPRPLTKVRQFAWELTNFLMKKRIKMLVIACNTATAAALEEIKERLDIPVVGVITSGARAAIKATNTGCVGVIGTSGTIQSGAYLKAIMHRSSKINVQALACPKFVPVVESNQFDSAIAEEIVLDSLKPIRIQKPDTLILGCTHYPLLSPVIQKVIGEDVILIDSGAETVSDVSLLLDYFGIQADKMPKNEDHEFYVTSSPAMFKEIAKNWLDMTDLSVFHVGLSELSLRVKKEVVVNTKDERSNGADNAKNSNSKSENFEIDERAIVIATHNLGKAKEFTALFKDRGYEVKTLLDYPELPEVIETGMTFEENARLKAETIARLLKRPVLADDSGLMVDELGGLPGVWSARFAGVGATDAANNAKLLHELSSLSTLPERRTAKFHCTLVFAAPERESLVVEADWKGSIATIPKGDNGFGYDPLFLVGDTGVTAAQLSVEEKNKVGHRAQAVAKLKFVWEEWLVKK
ncbi:MAG: glutamate racemase [Lactobacillales bacterium]|jgi:glutamate racemase|nr:glutamate racemase [Lactobacillales bacterium]